MIGRRILTHRFRFALPCLAALTACGSPAQAEMVLSKVIVDLQPTKPAIDDIEVWNSGEERIYVLAEPSEIQSPGSPEERRVQEPDPSISGLLVTPQRMVLEPGERRLIRIAAISKRQASDRVYRVTVKPVVGEIAAPTSALKILLGYDVLVLYRPETAIGQVEGTREGRNLTLSNKSNTAVEVYEGEQCNAHGVECHRLRSTRLYSGQSLTQQLPYDTEVRYRLADGLINTVKTFTRP